MPTVWPLCCQAFASLYLSSGSTPATKACTSGLKLPGRLGTWPWGRACEVGSTHSSCRVRARAGGKDEGQYPRKGGAPFRVRKRQFGLTKARYRSLKKNTAQIVTLSVLGSLWIERRQLMGYKDEPAREARKGLAERRRTPQRIADEAPKTSSRRLTCGIVVKAPHIVLRAALIRPYLHGRATRSRHLRYRRLRPRSGDDSGCGLRAVRGIAAHDGSPLGAVGRRSVEDVAQPGLLAVALLASAMLVVGVRELRL
jgi:hypothetical protein